MEKGEAGGKGKIRKKGGCEGAGREGQKADPEEEEGGARTERE